MVSSILLIFRIVATNLRRLLSASTQSILSSRQLVHGSPVVTRSQRTFRDRHLAQAWAERLRIYSFSFDDEDMIRQSRSHPVHLVARIYRQERRQMDEVAWCPVEGFLGLVTRAPAGTSAGAKRRGSWRSRDLTCDWLEVLATVTLCTRTA